MSDVADRFSSAIWRVQTPSKPQSAASVALAFANTLNDIEAALQSILGRGSVAALYQRCLHLSAPDHPWLAAVTLEAGSFWMDEPLQGAMARQSPTEATAAARAFLQAFDHLLVMLIGPELAERLLRPAYPSMRDWLAQKAPR